MPDEFEKSPIINIMLKKIISQIIFLFILLAAVFLSGCHSNELSRSQAQNLIEKNPDFNQPFVLPLMQGVIGGGGQGKLAISENIVETPAQAVERKTKLYFEIYPQIAVADHLGLVEPQVTAIQSEQPKHESWMDEPAWFFNEKYLLTDKAKALWSDLKLPPSDNSIPLARREFVEVTGIVKSGEDAAQAQFAWKYLPNETARYFDPATTEFKSLPDELRQRMLGRQPPTVLNRSPQDRTIRFAPAPRSGQAVFRRYDDGWRLESVTFQ